jgi:hypothetical protein
LVNAATINSGTIRLRAAGQTSDVPTTVSYAGSTATLQPLVPLAPEATYTVTVSGAVADRSGNTLESDVVWSFTTSWLAFADTLAADFSAGQTASGTMVVASGDGGLILAPQAGAEFSGTALPLGWYSHQYSGSGSAVVGGGLLTADGAQAGSSALFGPGQTLEFEATFTGDPYQHIGFGVDFSGPPWAIFSTGPGGVVRANSNNSIETLLPGVSLGQPHLFRIDWSASSVVYYVDGAQVASHNVTIAADLRPLASDFQAGGGAVTVDWMRLLPYAASGSFTSRVFDAGEEVAWAQALWTADMPAGTTLALAVRVGNTPTPDANWTDFVPLATSGEIVGMAARYAQYQAHMTTSAVNEFRESPTLQSVAFRYSSQVADVSSPVLLSKSPAASAGDVDLAAAVVIAFGDLIDPTTVNAATFRLPTCLPTFPSAAREQR